MENAKKKDFSKEVPGILPNLPISQDAFPGLYRTFQDQWPPCATTHYKPPVVCGETVYKSQFLIVNKRILKISNNKTLENSELENGLKKIYGFEFAKKLTLLEFLFFFFFSISTIKSRSNEMFTNLGELEVLLIYILSFYKKQKQKKVYTISF